VTFSILYVCTGNICRSPLAERYTAHRLADEAAGPAPAVVVSSTGVRGLEGHRMDPFAEDQLTRRGGSASGFAARRLTAGLVDSADLVLTMTRKHRAAALAEAPAALRRTFTLLEAADLARLVAGERSGADTGSPAALVAAMAGARSQARVEQYDVADPIGRSPRVHAAVADVITAAVDDLVAALVPRLRR
jgi:protein-tyrosine phosphatase